MNGRKTVRNERNEKKRMEKEEKQSARDGRDGEEGMFQIKCFQLHVHRTFKSFQSVHEPLRAGFL